MSLENGAEKINIYLQHGWGFDAGCWQYLLPYCCDSSITLADRGYFGGREAGDTRYHSGLNVTICHSLGLHFLAPEQLQRSDVLVIIAGFRTFHGERETEGRFSRRHVARMVTDLANDPVALLERFYHDCSYPNEEIDASAFNTTLLHDDLLLLDQHSFDLALLKDIPRVLVLHGLRDRIVPKERGIWLADSLANTSFFGLEDAGHGLIFTHPQQCWQIISENID